MQEHPLNFSVHTNLILGNVPFSAVLLKKESTLLAAGWEDEKNPIGLCELAQCLQIDLSYLNSWDIQLSKAQLSLLVKQEDPLIDFSLTSQRYGTLELSAQKKTFSMELQPPKNQKPFHCQQLPVIGSYLQKDDRLTFYGFSLEYSPIQTTACAYFSLVLFGKQIYENKKQKQASSLEKWVDIHKSVGPVTIRRMGFGIDGQFLCLLMDSAFRLGPITISTLGLCVQVPVDLDFEKTKCSIEGLSVEYSNGPLLLAGGLVCTQAQGKRYDGILQLHLPGICISALASYTVTDGAASLFVYGYLHLPVRTPTGFTITGISAGLGTNRRLLLPDIADVSSFPLVTMATSSRPAESTDQMLREMQQYLIGEKDSYFGAAGISFRAWGLLDGFALATLSFGKQLEIALLGQCTLVVPERSSAPIAKVILPFSVLFLPDAGEFSAQALVDSGSFLLDPNCHLTGGFAFFIWFSGEHAGDFVVSIGGYHPKFRAPDHYPKVDRVGVNWQMDRHLLLKGSLYFALTSCAIMAGGGISLTYQAGNLKAWVTAQADFLMQWAPVYYDIDVSVSVGASYRVDFCLIHHTFSVELGAELLLKGPPFFAKVHIKWCIISFTIAFGKERSAPAALSWDDFHKTFLPDQIIQIEPLAGIEQLEGEKGWNVTNSRFSLHLSCSVPLTAFQFANQPIQKPNSPALGIRPMNQDTLDSMLWLDCQKDTGKGFQPAALEWFLTQSSLPEALWGMPTGNPLSAEMISNCTTGVTLAAPTGKPAHTSPNYDTNTLMDSALAARQDLPPLALPAISPLYYDQQQTTQLLHKSDCPEVRQKRQEILSALEQEDFSFARCNITDFADNFPEYLRSIPHLGTIGAQEEC